MQKNTKDITTFEFVKRITEKHVKKHPNSLQKQFLGTQNAMYK